MSTARDLYLDLLKKSLTNTFFEKEPNPADGEERYIPDFVQHYIRGQAITMLPQVRLDNIRFCVEDALSNNVPGDLIETGVWRGGATIFMRGILRAHDADDRTVWVADSFEGLPTPDEKAYPLEAKAHDGPVMTKLFNHLAAGLDEVKNNFRAYGLLDDRVRFLKGWFKDTLPTAPIKQLAVMRLDGDYYESTRDALQSLYQHLSPGGYVIIDDYGQDTWTYCRKAVEDFRAEKGITEPLIQVDCTCHYWQRSSK
jgi:O-methyltransferase